MHSNKSTTSVCISIHALFSSLLHIYFYLFIFAILPAPTHNEYIAATIIPTSNIINTYTSYSFVLYRFQNPITLAFISPVSTVPSTAYI